MRMIIRKKKSKILRCGNTSLPLLNTTESKVQGWSLWFINVSKREKPSEFLQY
ncbi:hypothetical protein HanHA300_Chr15g0550641 [Helianthus annuus]|nr:hypothetical protein HanHA300_Chr15g0550641 [Helianthus annuus]KAJ0471634.1 hypothetical protein HanHA89_Chr15g0598281 [Helianthus annuus]KAJ0647274.1 hypothetical protein HanLR1_Chr15g0560081 [Helianthus annuus]